ncbi:hypothetical protein CWN80_02885 [Janibacter hoylei PVAS-1]|uniref:Uncharacterized protein n=1 Tax=Janibacter hoylei PVAS-1 TaxID=1210046 RepID=A0A444B9J8_9MICO|nr:hypothetical protein CWN80_02885 [Janibacter hoylei PVAS-1]
MVPGGSSPGDQELRLGQWRQLVIVTRDKVMTNQSGRTPVFSIARLRSASSQSSCCASWSDISVTA